MHRAGVKPCPIKRAASVKTIGLKLLIAIIKLFSKSGPSKLPDITKRETPTSHDRFLYSLYLKAFPKQG
jgi:hypothetical protein